MLDAKAKPQILEHLSKILTVTIHDTKCETYGLLSCQCKRACIYPVSITCLQVDTKQCSFCCYRILCKEYRLLAGKPNA